MVRASCPLSICGLRYRRARERYCPLPDERPAATPPLGVRTYRRKLDRGTVSAPLEFFPKRRQTPPSPVAIVPASRGRILALHFAPQPSTGGCPFALDRRRRDTQHNRSFFNGKPAKESQFHKPALLWIQIGEAL